MKSVVLAAALAVVAAPSLADPILDLAESKQCLTCHSVSGELTAPSFKSIGQQWQGVKNADIYLSMVIQRGGTQHFGCNMMPGPGARSQLTEAESTALVGWILSMK
jgi:cytochrome c